MKFTLEIELGNDAMRTWSDIRRALRRISDQSRAYPRVVPDECAVLDVNGNKVGKWEVG